MIRTDDKLLANEELSTGFWGSESLLIVRRTMKTNQSTRHKEKWYEKIVGVAMVQQVKKKKISAIRGYADEKILLEID